MSEDKGTTGLAAPEQAEKTPLLAQTATTQQQVIIVQPVPVASGPVFKDYPVWISDGKGGQV